MVLSNQQYYQLKVRNNQQSCVRKVTHNPRSCEPRVNLVRSFKYSTLFTAVTPIPNSLHTSICRCCRKLRKEIPIRFGWCPPSSQRRCPESQRDSPVKTAERHLTSVISEPQVLVPPRETRDRRVTPLIHHHSVTPSTTS